MEGRWVESTGCPQSAVPRSQELGPGVAGTMNTGGSSLSSPPTFLTTPATSGTYTQAADPVPVLIALACIFLLLASCLLFMMLCKPTALDPGRQGAREYMPHHPGSPSEPRLRLWKRLGSLRRSLHSFRRGRPAAQQCPLPGLDDQRGDCDFTEATEM
ncbi:uncharacterized protein C10orf105 homolog isoform X1 [Microtus ochrogaster]|uniref:Uncharacterized protein C10orf105 homolog isoform X1 n=2 Tax=Microtus ochrogaster TaxID=79684 RepID=A0ABM0L6U2_MICOH|nr:uncharacterized protein C10orf105 homolog isoform X1 [Microtus ochrogaster]